MLINTKSSARYEDAGDLFSDNFEETSTANWNDMKVWGFGVWQKKDGVFVSIDADDPAKNMLSALPNFQNAILNRDFSTVMKFKPVSGEQYQFTIDVRQQGWNNYKFQISQTGKISIIKNIAGSLPVILHQTKPNQIVFDQWQWMRFDVSGENPAVFKIKLWQGDLSNEPSFWNAIGVDDDPLQPANMNLALTSIQGCGAHTEIDNFNVYSKILPSSLWQWKTIVSDETELIKSVNEAKSQYQRGRYFLAEQSINKSLIKHPNHPVLLNNLAIVLASQNRFDTALSAISKTYRAAENDEGILHNLKWIWYGLHHDGLIQPVSSSFPNIALKIEKPVVCKPQTILFETSIAQAAVESKIKRAHIEIMDENDNAIWSTEKPFDKEIISAFSQKIDVSNWQDGDYKIVLRTNGKAEQTISKEFEIIRSAFLKIRGRLNQVQKEISKHHDQLNSEKIKNTWANLEVKLSPILDKLKHCDQPGYFQSQKETIEDELENIEQFLLKIQSGDDPFAHKTGSFMRGYYSEIDGSLQGFAVHAPEKYSPDQPFPLVINLHGYDPSYSSWQENLFLPVFMPHTTEKGRYIVVNPFGRGNTFYQNIGEHDVLHVIAELERLYNIDQAHVYLTGGSMGGAGTWNIGLAHPDKFAAMAPIMGPTEFAFWTGLFKDEVNPVRSFINARRSALSYAENALHVPIYLNHGVEDDIVPVEQSRKIVKRLRKLNYDIKYVEHPEVMHGGFPPEMDFEIFDWFEDKEQISHPKRVVFKAGDLNHAKAYWVAIERFVNQLDFARINVEIIEPNLIQIEANNIARFRLLLNDQLVNVRNPLKIEIDGIPVFEDKLPDNNELTFTAVLSDKKEIVDWRNRSDQSDNALIKKHDLCGPILDAFNKGFLLVYGTTGEPLETRVNRKEAERFSAQWEDWQHTRCRIKKDTEVTQEDIQRFHLMLFGNPKTNSINERIKQDLPVRFKDASIIFSDKKFTGKSVGVSMIYPNPLNQQRYVLIQAGTTWQGMVKISKRIGAEFDYIIFDNRTTGINVHQGNLTVDGSPLLRGFFDQDWQISNDYQWEGSFEMREQIVRRTFPEADLSETELNVIYLSEVEPDSLNQWTGTWEKDRCFWGTALRVDNQVYEKGIGVLPNSYLIYHPDGKWKTFSALLCVDTNPFADVEKEKYSGGKIQFAVYGDDHELFTSRVMDVNSEPQQLKLPIDGVETLKLVVRTQDWLPNFQQSASWVNAKLER